MKQNTKKLNVVFWVVTLCNLVVVSSVSEECAASAFRIKGFKTVLKLRRPQSTSSPPENLKSPKKEEGNMVIPGLNCFQKNK
jgi:hypothetical protein